MMQYHFTPDDIVNSERIIFSRGQYDPTSSIGPAKLPAVCEQNNSCILYVAGMAHQEDLFAPASYDSADLTQVSQGESISLTNFTHYLLFQYRLG
jgi:Serine carboxypeptidase S28.